MLSFQTILRFLPVITITFAYWTSWTVVVQGQTPPTAIPLSNNKCFISNITRGFDYDTNFNESGNFRMPSDPMGAVGMNRLVAVVRAMIEVRQKDGTLVFRDSLGDFFSTLNTTRDSINLSLAKVIYDEHQGRFVVVTVQQSTVARLSRILLAVSKDELPDSQNAWTYLSINSNITINGDPSFANTPFLEVDQHAVYITSNFFSFATFAPKASLLYIVNKGVDGGLYSGNTTQVPIKLVNPSGPFDAVPLATVVPTQVHGSGGIGGTGGTFLVSIFGDNDGNFTLSVITLTDPTGNPDVTLQLFELGNLGLLITTTTSPQNGTLTTVSTGSVEPVDAVWRNNKLFVTSTIIPTAGLVDVNQATVHWIRLDTTGGNITMEAQGNLGGESFTPGTFTYCPSVSLNKQGYAAFGYSASSPTSFIGAYGSLLSGTTEFPFTIQGGLDPYVRRDTNGRNRWSAWSGISLDPSDDSFWIFNQFADTRGSPSNTTGDDGRWGTVWARVYCTEAPPPTKAPTKTPTKSPTKRPTKTPTKSPTKTPTKSPTKTPTKSPTKTPTKTPTKLPTKAPIALPTNVLTKTPTKVPTKSPFDEKDTSCGIFGFNIFCPFTGCGFVGRLFGLCD